MCRYFLYPVKVKAYSSRAFLFCVSYITGVAMNTELYVPTITPMIKANIKPRIDSPPKIKMANNTNKVVTWHGTRYPRASA